MPGAAVPQSGLAVGHLVVPLVPIHPEMVLLGHPVLEHGVVEELVVSQQGALVQDQLATRVVEHVATLLDGVELPVIPPLGGAGIEPVALLDQALVLDFLGVFQDVLQGVLAAIDLGRQGGDVGVGIADCLQVRIPGEEWTGFGVLRGAPDLPVPRHDRPQAGEEVGERPGLEVGVVLDRIDQAGASPHRDVLVAADDDVGSLTGLDRQREPLLQLRPPLRAAEGRPFLDNDPGVAAFDLQFLVENVGGQRDGYETVALVLVRRSPDLDLNFRGLSRRQGKQNRGKRSHCQALDIHALLPEKNQMSCTCCRANKLNASTWRVKSKLE